MLILLSVPSQSQISSEKYYHQRSWSKAAVLSPYTPPTPPHHTPGDDFGIGFGVGGGYTTSPHYTPGDDFGIGFCVGGGDGLSGPSVCGVGDDSGMGIGVGVSADAAQTALGERLAAVSRIAAPITSPLSSPLPVAPLRPSYFVTFYDAYTDQDQGGKSTRGLYQPIRQMVY